MRNLLYAVASLLFLSCNNSQSDQLIFFPAKNDSFKYSGRTEAKESGVALINSSASVSTRVFGDSCVIYLETGNEQHHFISLELNDGYLGRYRIKQDSISLKLPNNGEGAFVRILKDTEASNGSVIFKGISATKIVGIPDDNRPEIEFIGNSITCGMGADRSVIDCEEGEWYDQHNAYLAYGPRVARALNLNYELNCVSGMGMYRNWNDEDQPVMSQVYPNLYLNADDSKKADLESNSPEIVSISLGTNDLSLGDGEKERADFDPEIFKQRYIAFVKNIFNYYPDTKVTLISSPMIGEEEDEILVTCLMEIKAHFKDGKVFVFDFDKLDPGGCTFHPDIEDHREMARALIPFYKNLLN